MKLKEMISDDFLDPLIGIITSLFTLTIIILVNVIGIILVFGVLVIIILAGLKYIGVI